MQASIVFLLRVQYRRKESSRSLSHLLMSFLYVLLLSVQCWPRLDVITFCIDGLIEVRQIRVTCLRCLRCALGEYPG